MVIGARRAGLSISKTADLLGFSKPSLGFPENGPKNRKYPVSGQLCVGKCLVMSEVRGEWVDWLEIIERQQ